MLYQRGFSQILIFIVILISVSIIGGTYYFSKTSNSIIQQPTIVRTSSQPTISPNLLNSDQTSDWKTYTNSRYKFTLKYPPIFTPQENSFTTSFMTASSLKNSSYIKLDVYDTTTFRTSPD